ncbi:hypothetical protein QU926_17470 [Pseudomonas asiatica]|uniref:hypothetical protein n=1 Tax=Pseudomonas asiatica TaxID=2219225 RepID=UPI0025AA9DB3|nr:hypothetical protein [Pseudomonas asiatica]MDM9555418.1 hypothetical protein [Pseudomonas asiatica]
MPVTSLRKTSARPPEVAKIKIKIKIKIKSSAALGLGQHRQNSTIRVKCRPPPFSAKGSLP